MENKRIDYDYVNDKFEESPVDVIPKTNDEKGTERVKRVSCEKCIHNRICSLKGKVDGIIVAEKSIEYPIIIEVKCQEYIERPKLIGNLIKGIDSALIR